MKNITDEHRKKIVNCICNGTDCSIDNCPFSYRSKSFIELCGNKEQLDLGCIATQCSDLYCLKAQKWAITHMKNFLSNAKRMGYVHFSGITFK